LRRKAAQLDEFQAECFYLGEHAVKRGLVGQCAREHGVRALSPGLEGWERGTDRLAQVAANTDLVSLRLGIAVRAGHLLTVDDTLARAWPGPRVTNLMMPSRQCRVLGVSLPASGVSGQ
jgi:hypothetical protein